MPESMSKYMSDRVPERMPDRIDRMSETMPDKIKIGMSDRNVRVYARKNVL